MGETEVGVVLGDGVVSASSIGVTGWPTMLIVLAGGSSLAGAC